MALKPEESEMIAIFDYLRAKYPTLLTEKKAWHTANERKCSKRFGGLLKRMGVIRGISDIFIAKQRKEKGYAGLFIEVKAKQASGRFGKATIDQLAFIQSMRQEGYAAELALGADAAIKIIDDYLS